MLAASKLAAAKLRFAPQFEDAANVALWPRWHQNLAAETRAATSN